MKSFVTPDGVNWGVEVQVPGASNALIVFHHPDGSTSRKDRYAWLQWKGPEADNVTTRIDIDKVRGSLDQKTMEDLFMRSMRIGDASGPGILAA